MDVINSQRVSRFPCITIVQDQATDESSVTSSSSQFCLAKPGCPGLYRHIMRPLPSCQCQGCSSSWAGLSPSGLASGLASGLQVLPVPALSCSLRLSEPDARLRPPQVEKQKSGHKSHTSGHCLLVTEFLLIIVVMIWIVGFFIYLHQLLYDHLSLFNIFVT